MRLRVILIFLMASLMILPSYALSNIESSPNYLVLLVHGLGDKHGVFAGEQEISFSGITLQGKGFAGDIKKYLEENLGLKGYVYAYDFSENKGKLEKMGWELGDRNYHNPNPEMDGLCWLEKAKVDFAKQNPGKPVPQKFVLIGHSMGGLAIRHYIFGKSQNGESYYNNDVEKVITIASPHSGSDTANLAKMNDEYWKGNEFVVATGAAWLYIINRIYNQGYSLTSVVNPLSGDTSSFYNAKYYSLSSDINPSGGLPSYYSGDSAYSYIQLNNPFDILDWRTNYLDATAINAAAISPALIMAISKLYDSSPAADDLQLDSSIIKELRAAKADINSDPIKYRLIAGSGIPTPNAGLSAAYLFARPMFGVHPMIAFMTSSLWSMPTNQEKLEALLFSFSGAVFTNNGDLAVPIDSAHGLGVEAFSNGDVKQYTYTFKDESMEGFLNGFPALYGGSQAAYYLAQFFGTPEWIARWILIIPSCSLSYQVARETDNIKNDLFGHWAILKKAYESDMASSSIIEQSLDDTPAVGGSTTTGLTKSGISASAVNSPTASFNGPDQAFILLSNLDYKGNDLGEYHTVTIEAITKGNDLLSFPVVIDGTRESVSSVTVKEPPTAVKGVIDTYLPQKLKQFQYSENFAAWKNVGEVDEWGNFTLKGLQLAEGQNIIAFRSTTWTGNEGLQHLKIVVNSIPLLPTAFVPQPNFYLNETSPLLSVEFNKSEYSGNYEDEKINIKEMLVDGVAVAPQVQSSMESYHPWAKASYQVPADAPLSEGEHQIAVKAESNVGISQGLWSFFIDRSPPVITIEAIAPYNVASPMTIRYSTYDQMSPNLRNLSCDLYDSSNKLIANIATAESLSKGENFFNWDGSGVKGADGSYKIKIRASDLAGNTTVAEQPIVIDSTPPTIAGMDVSPLPMTSKSTELGLTARVNERATVIIKLTNTADNSITAYVSQAEPAPDGNGALSTYKWKYDNMFAKGPDDGTYRMEVSARDAAGNESQPQTLETVVIDRTPPKIYGQITSPYVLSNIGKNAYKTTLSYNLSDAGKVKIKIYNSNTGQLVYTIDDAPFSNSSKNEISWYGGDPKYPKGAYRLQIVAEDKYGNVGTAYASCVKDGIAPEISYPLEDNTVVSGTSSIRGTAIDPDWTNDKPFKNYKVYYKKSDGLAWESTFIEVPQVNRDPKDPKNVSVRPLQNNSTLAYLYTNNLENGDYTIKVEVNEENGESLSAARLIKVNNDPMIASSIQTPYIKLRSLPGLVEFKSDDSVKMPLGFINSVKPANVYVEVTKTGSVETPVYYKYFPNILGAPFIGEPDYKPGIDLGYFIWSDDNGYHIRWSADGSNHKFTGNIILTSGAGYSDVKTIGSGITVKSPLISWDSSISGGEGGIDFKVTSGQLMISTKIDEDPANPSVYADNVFLGVSKMSQQYLPIIIDAAGQRLVSVTNMGAAAESSNMERATQTIEWNGKLDTGAYPDSGNYVVRVRAEGVDGVGVATDESMVEIKTPFEVTNLKVDPADQKFSTLGGIDRVSVFYNVSKDSLVTANVFDGSDKYVATIAEDKEVLGTTNPNNQLSIVWRGNFPDPDSGTVVTGGTYKIKMNVAAKDGSDSKPIDIDNISITKYDFNDDVVSLDPLGEETPFNNGSGLENIRLAQGDSPYYFEARGSGYYHPAKDFRYTLSASGKQTLTAYPYIPIAGLMHRGFSRVKIKVKVSAQGKYADSYFDAAPWHFGWQRAGETDFSGIQRKAEDHDLVPSNDSFELSDNAHSDDLFGHPAGVNQPSKAMTDVNMLIKFCAKDDETLVLDTFKIFNSDLQHDPTVEAGSTRASEKGMFNVTFKKSSIPDEIGYIDLGFVKIPYVISHEYNHRDGEFYYRYRVKVELASKIPYSRLTNRFVPWIGFINAKTPESERTKDFGLYLTDINKGLGFPGKLFFDDPNAKPDKANKSEEEIAAEFNGLSWADKLKKLDSMANEASLLGYKDSLSSTVGYDTYLADGYITFIPITKPIDIKGQPKDFEKINDSTYRATTDLVLKPDDNPYSPIVEDWPLNKARSNLEKEYSANKSVADWKKDLTSWTGYSNKGQTYFELDETEYNARTAQNSNTKTFTDSGQRTIYDKSKGYGWWQSKQIVGDMFNLPDFVKDGSYSVPSGTDKTNVSLTSTGRNGYVYAEDNDKQGISWTTVDDNALLSSGGQIKSPGLTFNEDTFSSRRELKISNFYSVKEDYQSVPALKYAFVRSDPFGRTSNSPIDNPNVVITGWNVALKDKTGGTNKDIVLEKVDTTTDKDWQSHWKNDKLKLKLKLDASESRYVEILGNATGPYELMYFDGNTWKTFVTSNSGASGHLGWWNVGRLNGKYTVLLKSGSYIATKDVSIGTLIKKDEKMSAYSTYKRAQLEFPKGAFVNGSKLSQDQLVTITPVSMNEIYIRNRPIIITSGPIVEIKPSPWKFRVSTLEGVDERPTLKFIYTFDDLADPKLGLWDKSQPLPKAGADLGLPMNIHQVTAGGDLQIVSGNRQEVELNNGELQYAFYAPLDHFSTYALLPGKFSLSAPIVLADRYITNKETVNIHGTAEPDSILDLYVVGKNDAPPPFLNNSGGGPDVPIEKSEVGTARREVADPKGYFEFKDVGLVTEGKNTIYVTSSPKDNPEIKTWSDVTIVKDTVPPSVEASQNLYAFSPNGDGKYDSVDYLLKSNEAGNIYLSVMSNASGATRQLLNQEISAEANNEVKLTWAKDAFQLYRRDNATGQWILFSEIPISERLADGAYNTIVYAIDEAGNIANNVISQTIIDTTPPAVLGLNADPNPFTPNDDGVKDTTMCHLTLSVPPAIFSLAS